MRKKLILMTIALACATAQGAWAQQDGSPLRPVSAADVKVTAINDAYFTDEGIVVVSPDEDLETALARSRASGMTSEGGTSTTGAKLYSYTYPSVDADGNEVTLSSLMAVPTKMLIDNVMAKPNNLIIGCHVTITSNFECPTEYNKSGGTFSWMTDVGMLIGYTRYDAIRNPCCLVIMPDYEGYGVTKNRAHPYLYQELTARQVVDAVRSGLALYEQNIGLFSFSSFEEGWKSVCVGYSQGGSVALATHRFIEENGLAEELHFAGSVCGDGPYDPVAHLGYYMNDEGETYNGEKTQHEKATVSMPIVMPLILKGMCDRNPFMRQHQVSDYLTPKFLHTGVIDFINAKSQDKKEKQYSTGGINEAFRDMRKHGKGQYSAAQMEEMLYKDDGDNVHGKLVQIMTETAYGYFNGLSSNSEVPSDRGMMKDLHRALASNARVSGWTPSHRIAFYHSTYDTVVPYDNLLSFIRHQNGLNYYFHSRQRSQNAHVTPSHMVDNKESADVYIYDTHTREDHVKAGRAFYFLDSPSPDYMLMKWVVEGKKSGAASAASSDDDLITITLHNGSKNITAEAYRRGSSIIVGNGQNACISQYTEGPINIPGTVEIGGQNYNVEVNQLAFRLCNKITEVTIGEGTTWIGDFAFVGCSSLQKVTLPSTLNRIGGGAFVNLPLLTEVKCAAAAAPAWLYNDLFAYEGTASATAKLATQRTLYVPRASARKYRNSKYNGEVGWGDAFALISEADAPTKTMTISTFKELGDLADAVNNGSNDYADYTIRLTADLIQNGDNRDLWYALIPIGTADHPFRGVFDGQGHTIKNVRTYRDNGTDVGLFGYTNGAVISNLILQNISLKGESNVGVVVGNANYSMIHDVLAYEAKSTTGEPYYCAEATDGNAGGLVGKADNSTIIDSYFYGRVKGIAAAGGIVGESSATDVSDCAAGSSVEATGYSIEAIDIAGGIVGKAGEATKVGRCYSRNTFTATTVGGIIGQHQGDSESSISSCAYLDANESLLVAVAAGEDSEFTATGNRRCATVSDMEGLKLKDLLGDDKWYYFHEDISDCPVPASLADAYLAWAGMKDANGYIFAPNDTEASSYSIIGYEGSKTELELPETYKDKPVTKVGDRAFKGSAITYMTIPDCYTSIGTEAFADCTDLIYVFLGDNIESEYNGWLNGCPNIAALYASDKCCAYTFTNHILYDKAQTRLIRCEKGIEGTLTLPVTVTKIEPGAFVNCDNLNIVDMRETTTNWKELDRNLSTNPIYGASIYTLFLLNKASYNYNYLNGEPNVVTYDGEKYHCRVLNIDDSRGFQCPVKFDATKVNYNRQFTAALSYDVEDVENRTSDFVYKPKAYTLNLPFKPYFNGNGLKLYRYSGVTTEDGVTTVSFEQVSNSSAHSSQPYCVVMEGEETVGVYGSEANINAHDDGSGGVAHGDYEFHGTLVNYPNETLYNASQPAYILQSDGNWHKVPENQPKAYVGPFRAYFRAVTPSAGARALVTSFGDGDETGIHQTVMRTIDHDGTEHYYDLNGHRLSSKPQQGIYIHQGKKHVAK